MGLRAEGRRLQKIAIYDENVDPIDIVPAAAPESAHEEDCDANE